MYITYLHHTSDVFLKGFAYSNGHRSNVCEATIFRRSHGYQGNPIQLSRYKWLTYTCTLLHNIIKLTISKVEFVLLNFKITKAISEIFRPEIGKFA